MDGYLGTVKTEIEVLLNTRKELLCSGSAKDFAEYKHLVGDITGLRRAIGVIEDLQMRIDRNNGDTEDDSG